MSSINRFETERLLVTAWHDPGPEDWSLQALAQTIQAILTPAVTATLPGPWQGHYTTERALKWIGDRDREGTALLVVERSSAAPVGLLVLFEGDSRDIRIGYILAESAWGNGFATELIRGFVDRCRHNDVRSITGGVAADNLASQRVLIKNGFAEAERVEGTTERFFTLVLGTD